MGLPKPLIFRMRHQISSVCAALRRGPTLVGMSVTLFTALVLLTASTANAGPRRRKPEPYVVFNLLI